jgi:hypothetical protein
MNIDIEQAKALGKRLGSHVEESVYLQFIEDTITVLIAELRDAGIHPEVLEGVAEKAKANMENVRKTLYNRNGL